VFISFCSCEVSCQNLQSVKVSASKITLKQGNENYTAKALFDLNIEKRYFFISVRNSIGIELFKIIYHEDSILFVNKIKKSFYLNINKDKRKGDFFLKVFQFIISGNCNFDSVNGEIRESGFLICDSLLTGTTHYYSKLDNSDYTVVTSSWKRKNGYLFPYSFKFSDWSKKVFIELNFKKKSISFDNKDFVYRNIIAPEGFTQETKFNDIY
jgi:hypothetical protein